MMGNIVKGARYKGAAADQRADAAYGGMMNKLAQEARSRVCQKASWTQSNKHSTTVLSVIQWALVMNSSYKVGLVLFKQKLDVIFPWRS
jgi:hypothetical protein